MDSRKKNGIRDLVRSRGLGDVYKRQLHGGANEAVMHMFKEIKKPEKAEKWINNALNKKKVVMGFGHRVYRSGDSRVPTMKKYFFKVAQLMKNTKYPQMYETLEKVMLERKNIHPNVDYPCLSLIHI